MDVSLHTNTPNLVAQYTLNSTNKALEAAIERVATGLKVNSVADDAAGLQIATRLEAQSRGMGMAMRNSQDAISMMQMAEGAMDEMTNVAFRMYELAVQASNGANSQTDQEALNSEFVSLAEQLVTMQSSVRFGGQKLVGSEGIFTDSQGVQFQIGADSKDVLEVNISDLIDAIFVVTQDIASNYSIASQSEAQSAMDILNGNKDGSESGVIGAIGTARSMFGAYINTLGHNITHLEAMKEGVDEAKGRIVDHDMS